MTRQRLLELKRCRLFYYVKTKLYGLQTVISYSARHHVCLVCHLNEYIIECFVTIRCEAAIKTQISNLVCTTRFWRNNIEPGTLRVKRLGSQIIKVLGAGIGLPMSRKRIWKLGNSHLLCLCQEILSFNNTFFCNYIINLLLISIKKIISDQTMSITKH